jgi:hypothetical protein
MRTDGDKQGRPRAKDQEPKPRAKSQEQEPRARAKTKSRVVGDEEASAHVVYMGGCVGGRRRGENNSDVFGL